jgi:hypothetical protein
MLVWPGNPRHIASFRDLLVPGVRVLVVNVMPALPPKADICFAAIMPALGQYIPEA